MEDTVREERLREPIVSPTDHKARSIRLEMRLSQEELAFLRVRAHSYPLATYIRETALAALRFYESPEYHANGV